MKKKMTRLVVAGALTIALCVPAAGAAMAATPPDVSPSARTTLHVRPAAKIVATSADTTATTAADKASQAGYVLEGLDQVRYPWYAVVQEDGAARFTWGPGLSAASPASADAQVVAKNAAALSEWRPAEWCVSPVLVGASS